MIGELVVYGGSFDPPHMAHVLALCAARAHLGDVEFLVLPSFSHPFAKQLAPFDARVALCVQAFGWIPGLRVSHIEAELARAEPAEQGVRTVHVLRALRTQFPGRRMRLLLGSDILHDAPKWHRWDEVCALAPPLVLGRQGHEHPDAPPAILPQISSREVRARLLDGSKLPEEWLPAGVLQCIHALQLYGAYKRP